MPTLTEAEAQDRALTAVRAGCDDPEVRAYARIDFDTWVRWMNDTDFGDEVEEERGKLAVLASGSFVKGMTQDPQSALMFLEHQETQRNLDRLKRLTHPELYDDEAA